MCSDNSSEAPDFKEEFRCSPRRFGVHFYIKIACVLYALITVMAFRYWDRSISLYLESVIAEVESEGGLLDLTGLKPPVLADEDNAVWWYDLAGTKDPFSVFQTEPAEYNDLDEGGEQIISASEQHLSELSEKWSRIKDINKWGDAVRQYPAVSRELCDLFAEMAECIHRGGQCEASDWGFVFFTFKQWNTVLPLYSIHRESARRLAFMVRVEADMGNTAAALKHADSIFAMSRHIDSVYVSIQIWISSAIEDLACSAICDSACSLELDSSEDRQAVESMIANLNRPGQALAFYERGVMVYRGQAYNVYQEKDFFKEEFPLFKMASPLGAETVANLYVAQEISMCSRYIRELDEEYYNRDKLEELQCLREGLVLKGVWIFGIHPERLWERTISNLVSRRLAAISLMLRLYEADHGHLPDSLEELEGEYITKLPIDPFSPSRSGFIYRRDGNSARIYSVGEDGKDDGGRNGNSSDQMVEYRTEAEDLSDLFEGLTAP